MQEQNITKEIFSGELRRLMAAEKLTQSELASHCGVGQSAVNKWLSGTIPQGDMLQRIAERFSVPMESLLSGKVKQRAPANPQNWGGPYHGTTDMVPVVAFASAGGGGYYEDQEGASPMIRTTCKDPNCYAVKIEGDSMLPDFQPGDIAVTTPNIEPQNGDYVIAILKDGKVYFKKLQYTRDRKGLLLISLNQNYGVIDVPLKEVRKVHPVHSTQRFLKEKIF